MTRTVLVLNGPNLDRLGSRQPELYGAVSLPEVLQRLAEVGSRLGVELQPVQSNHEGALIDAVHAAHDQGACGALVNAGGYTHTSVALRDALAAVSFPFVEIHVSNVWAREPFRHQSLLSDRAVGVVAGLGVYGYELALMGLVQHLDGRSQSGEV